MMNRLPSIVATLLLVVACRASNGQAQENPDDLKKRIEELIRETARLRGELVRARIEILDLKVRDARRAKNFDEETRLLLQDGLDSEFAEVQEHAFKELLNLPAERRKSAVAPILQKWEKAGDRFRVLAIPFLAASGDDDASKKVLECHRDASPDVRRAAAAVLKSSADPRAFDVLKALLKDPQKEVRAAAVDALAVPKREDAVKPLIEFVAAEKAPELLEKAADAFGVIGSAEAVPVLLRMLSGENKSVQWSCIKSLGLLGDPRALETLRPYLSPEQPSDIREITTRSLGRLKDAVSLPTLERMVAEETEGRLRDAAAEAIGRIGDPKAIDGLMKAHEREKEEAPRKTIWRSILRLAEAQLADLDKVATWLISRGLPDEVEEVAAKVAAWAGENGSARIAAILSKIADFTYERKLWLEARAHYQRLLKYAPANWDAHRKLSKCYLAKDDFENAIRTLQEAAEKAQADRVSWWLLKLDLVSALAKLDDPYRTVDETFVLLFQTPDAPAEAEKQNIVRAYDAAREKIAAELKKDEDASREKTVKLGKKIIVTLAEMVEKAPSPGLIKAGNAITGTAIDPATTEPAKLKEAATAWRNWYNK